jgi:hemerythrin-like metal-binding protein
MIKWDDQYSVGISIIDEEHKKLIDVMNIAIVAKEQNYNSDKTKEVFNAMVEYTNKQFSTEEEDMLKSNLPRYLFYRNELLNYIDSMIANYKDLTMDNYQIINEILEFLKQWFVNHILETDKEYINCFNENGLYNSELNKDTQIFQFKSHPSKIRLTCLTPLNPNA